MNVGSTKWGCSFVMCDAFVGGTVDARRLPVLLLYSRVSELPSVNISWDLHRVRQTTEFSASPCSLGVNSNTYNSRQPYVPTIHGTVVANQASIIAKSRSRSTCMPMAEFWRCGGRNRQVCVRRPISVDGYEPLSWFMHQMVCSELMLCWY